MEMWGGVELPDTRREDFAVNMVILIFAGILAGAFVTGFGFGLCF